MSEVKYTTYKCRTEAAESLCIPVNQLPFNAAKLKDDQRKKLSVPRINRRIKLKTPLGNIVHGFQYSDDGQEWAPTAEDFKSKGLLLIVDDGGRFEAFNPFAGQFAEAVCNG